MGNSPAPDPQRGCFLWPNDLPPGLPSAFDEGLHLRSPPPLSHPSKLQSVCPARKNTYPKVSDQAYLPCYKIDNYKFILLCSPQTFPVAHKVGTHTPPKNLGQGRITQNKERETRNRKTGASQSGCFRPYFLIR